MTCEYLPPRKDRQRLSDIYRELGDDIKVAWLRKHGRDELLSPWDGGFMCGTFKPSPRCRCGQIADYLCDVPMGKGKTCDLPLCQGCKTSIGEDLDVCPFHARYAQQLVLFPREER